MRRATRPDEKDRARRAVREGYARVAGGERPCCTSSAPCCGAGASEAAAKAVGYSDAELAVLPEGANMGLSCGNPTALASLRSGEVVLDLGSGGGLDVFVAASKVGPTGRAIGVDMTPEMVSKARGNAAAFQERTGLDNVEFRLGEIEHLPVADASVDVVISNCVINLSPDKPQVWREVARVLKPGGRVAVSDLALKRSLPPAIQESVSALVGCIAGAVLVEETRRMVQAAGLVDAQLATSSALLDQMAGCADPLWQELVGWLPPGTRLGDFVTSLSVTARKPGRVTRKGRVR